MAELTSLNIKIDRELKAEADVLFNAMGMTLSTAVNVFVRQAVNECAMPFQIRTDPKAIARDNMWRAFKSIQEESVKNGTNNMTMSDIDAEIAEYRRYKRDIQ